MERWILTTTTFILSGLGRQIKHARILSNEDEEKQWCSQRPQALQNAVFFTVGKVFSLRGGCEMQIKRFQYPDKYSASRQESNILDFKLICL